MEENKCEHRSSGCKYDRVLETIDTYLEQAIVGTFRGMFKSQTYDPSLKESFQRLLATPPKPQMLQKWYQQDVRDCVLPYLDLDLDAFPTLAHLLKTRGARRMLPLLGNIVLTFADKIDWTNVSIQSLSAFDETLRKQVRAKVKSIRPILDQMLSFLLK